MQTPGNCFGRAPNLCEIFSYNDNLATVKRINALIHSDEGLTLKTSGFESLYVCQITFTPFAVHLRKIYIHLRQQLKLYGKYTFISTSMNFINANELSITLLEYVLTFNSINR